MLNPDKNTPIEAYQVPISVPIMTCRPTLYLGLSYFGVSSVARPIFSADHIQPGTTYDFAVFGSCLLIAFLMAQVLEYRTRPLRPAAGFPRGVAPVRGDRASRLVNLLLAVGGFSTSIVATGFHWSAHVLMIAVIISCTGAGELLYQRYGKHHPYQPKRATRSRRRQPVTS